MRCKARRHGGSGSAIAKPISLHRTSHEFNVAAKAGGLGIS